MKKIASLIALLFLAITTLSAAEWFSEKFPPKLLNTSGKTVDAAAALKGKTVLIYFSASWCGPCRDFTPQLIKFYKSAAKRNNLEIIFVSLDKSSADMMKYMKNDKMPWLAVPFNSPMRNMLRQEFKVNGIPTLVVLDSKGKVISKNARWDVVILGTGAIKAWRSSNYKPKTFQDYKNADMKNNKKKK